MYKKYWPLLVTIILFIVIYSIGSRVPEESIRLVINNAGAFGPIVYILLALITSVIAPLSGSPILFAGFYAFGRTVIFYSLITVFIASIINFWIARLLGQIYVEKIIGKENMEKVNHYTEKHGLFFLFLLRVFQGGINDFISYAAGLTKIKFTPYFIVSSLGMIPGTILWYLLSAQIKTPLDFLFLTATMMILMSVIFLLGSLLFKKK